MVECRLFTSQNLPALLLCSQGCSLLHSCHSVRVLGLQLAAQLPLCQGQFCCRPFFLIAGRIAFLLWMKEPWSAKAPQTARALYLQTDHSAPMMVPYTYRLTEYQSTKPSSGREPMCTQHKDRKATRSQNVHFCWLHLCLLGYIYSSTGWEQL